MTLSYIYFVIKNKQPSKQYILSVRGRRGRGRMVVGFTTTIEPMPITTDAASSNPDLGEVYNIM